MEAYSTARKKWPLWYVLVTTLIQCAVGQAERLVAAAAVAYYFFSEALGLPIHLTTYAVILGVVSVVVILLGRYKAVEIASKILGALLIKLDAGGIPGRAPALFGFGALLPLRNASRFLAVNAG